jgi:hypothetical protein
MRQTACGASVEEITKQMMRLVPRQHPISLSYGLNPPLRSKHFLGVALVGWVHAVRAHAEQIDDANGGQKNLPTLLGFPHRLPPNDKEADLMCLKSNTI